MSILQIQNLVRSLVHFSKYMIYLNVRVDVRVGIVFYMYISSGYLLVSRDFMHYLLT